MSRAATGDVVIEKPRNNIITVLVGVAVLVELIGFLALFMRAGEIFVEGKNLFN